MKKLVLSALILATISPAWAAAGPRKPLNSERLAGRIPVASVDASQADVAVLDGTLRDLAKALASTLNDPRSRRLIKEEVGKKFDGDFEVLYRELANRRVGNGRVFRQALGNSLAKEKAKEKGQGRPYTAGDRAGVQANLDRLTSSLPKLQIAVPAGFAQWDPESEAPLVAYVPEGLDDDEIQEVEAFDAEGRSYMLDARIEPTVPVVVVGLNERTDENGYLLNDHTAEKDCGYPIHDSESGGGSSTDMAPCEDPVDPYEPYDPGGDNPYEPVGPTATPTLGVCDSRTHNAGDPEIFYQIKINDDHEPWFKGSPEIYATYSFVDNQGIKGQYHMGNVDDTGQWYTVNGQLFYWQSDYGNNLAMAIWEKDGSDFGTFSYSFYGFTFSVHIQDGDDQLGANPVSFFDPVCGYYSTGDAEYKMRYQAQ